jgi:hypothetical protein
MVSEQLNCLAFARTLKSTLIAAQPIPSSAAIDLHRFNDLLSVTRSPARSIAKSASQVGVDLWNLITKASNSGDDGVSSQLVVLGKLCNVCKNP